ncbi:MAG TPA: CAP domain-containing protein [Rhodothermales bacterium]|nr:CAP domain-containing protein [Rhodothermales bacterium]
MARTCGAVRFEAAAPLELDGRLATAAYRHVRDLAAIGRVSHVGSDGSTAASRAAEAGYTGTVLGEVVAGGDGNAKAVVAGWLNSPEHCRVLMDPRATQAGAAMYGRYWTLVVAAPAP